MSGFDESKHPRDSHGRFASTGGGSNRSMQQRMHRELGRRAHTGEQHMLQPDGSHAHNISRMNAGARAMGKGIESFGAEPSKADKAAIARQFGRVHNPLAHARHGAAQKASKGAYDISKDPTRGNMDPSVAYAAIGQKTPTSRVQHTPASHTIRSAHRRSR